MGGADEMLARARTLTEAGIALSDASLRRPTLDDVFLALTGRPAEPDASPDESDDPDPDGSDRSAQLAGDLA
jgi:ABC-2 type transport system ATP-binding protein